MGNKTTTAVFESIKKGGDCLGRCIARGLGCERVPDCNVARCPECIDGWWGIFASTIEHEKAEAVSAAMGEHLREWAEDNGLPSFHEEESIKAWLDRCFLPRPLFEDGEPVQIGDKVLNYDRERTVDNIAVAVYGTECLLLAFVDSPEKRLKRPAPKVLDADGVPIEVGDTVYIDESHAPKADEYDFNAGPESFGLLGVSPNDALVVANAEHFTCGHRFVLFKGEDRAWCPASWLTHKEPDTQECINADALKLTKQYWECAGYECDDCPSTVFGKTPDKKYGVGNCTDAMKLDLLRRQRELDARMGGE